MPPPEVIPHSDRREDLSGDVGIGQSRLRGALGIDAVRRAVTLLQVLRIRGLPPAIGRLSGARSHIARRSMSGEIARRATREKRERENRDESLGVSGTWQHTTDHFAKRCERKGQCQT
jgi:hypothetical protein